MFSCSVFSNSKSIERKSHDDVNPQKTTIDAFHENVDKLNDGAQQRTARQTDFDDGYVMEDMSLLQNDQPAFMRSLYGQSQREQPLSHEKVEQNKRGGGPLPQNTQFTKEVIIKQGRLKGHVRSMHPQTGLKNVRQYLGIPYAAAPIGNGRFMPPGINQCNHSILNGLKLTKLIGILDCMQQNKYKIFVI